MRLIYEQHGKERFIECQPDEVGDKARAIMKDKSITELYVFSEGKGRRTLRYWNSANNGETFCELIGEDT